MNERSFDPQTANFISSLEAIETLLYRHDNKFWAGKIAEVRRRALNPDRYCVHLFLSYFGSMGSLNDLIFDEHGPAHEQFEMELNKAYALADDIRRSLI